MAIRFLCPFGHRLLVPDHRAGKKGRCPVCRQLVIVPVLNPVSSRSGQRPAEGGPAAPGGKLPPAEPPPGQPLPGEPLPPDRIPEAGLDDQPQAWLGFDNVPGGQVPPPKRMPRHLGSVPDHPPWQRRGGKDVEAVAGDVLLAPLIAADDKPPAPVASSSRSEAETVSVRVRSAPPTGERPSARHPPPPAAERPAPPPRQPRPVRPARLPSPDHLWEPAGASGPHGQPSLPAPQRDDQPDSRALVPAPPHGKPTPPPVVAATPHAAPVPAADMPFAPQGAPVPPAGTSNATHGMPAPTAGMPASSGQPVLPPGSAPQATPPPVVRQEGNKAVLPPPVPAAAFTQAAALFSRPPAAGMSGLGTNTAQQQHVRRNAWFQPVPVGTPLAGWRAHPDALQNAYWLAVVLGLVTLFSAAPLVNHIELQLAPVWAQALAVLVAVQLAYVVWLAALPDAATLRVGMILFAAVAAAYALVTAAVLATPAEKPPMLDLGELGHTAWIWCGANVVVMALMSFLCGHAGAAWRQR